MTWKEILKIDMGEARRLGEKYAPDDMQEDRMRANRKSLEDTKDKRNEYYQKFLRELYKHEDKIKPEVYEGTLSILELLKDVDSYEEFLNYKGMLKNIARTIPNFNFDGIR